MGGSKKKRSGSGEETKTNTYAAMMAAFGLQDAGIPNGKARTKGGRARDYLAVYPLVREIMAAEQADWMHDFTDAFDRDDYIYIDSCHVNALGNEIIAKRIDAIVGERLRGAKE